MKEELTMLLNTLALIETKGDGTLKMAASLQHIQKMIKDCEKQEKKINQSVPCSEVSQEAEANQASQ